MHLSRSVTTHVVSRLRACQGAHHFTIDDGHYKLTTHTDLHTVNLDSRGRQNIYLLLNVIRLFDKIFRSLLVEENFEWTTEPGGPWSRVPPN